MPKALTISEKLLGRLPEKSAVLHCMCEARGAELAERRWVRYLGIGCQDQHIPGLAHAGDLYRTGDKT